MMSSLKFFLNFWLYCFVYFIFYFHPSVSIQVANAYDTFLMYSNIVKIDSIDMFDENNPNAPFPSISSSEHMKNVIGLSFDYESSKLFYSDIQKGTINSVSFNGSDHTVIVEKQGSVEGLAYDPINKDLYWTTLTDRSLSRISLAANNSGPEVIILLGSKDKPRGIDVDGCSSKIFWTNWNNKYPSIQRADLDGSGVQSIIVTDISMPNAIALDHKTQKLYWADAKLDKVELCNFDGTQRQVLIEHVPHPFDLAVYADFIFWTDWVSKSVKRADKYTGGNVVTLRKNLTVPMAIIAVANDTDCTLNPCHVLNGGCEDLCNVAVDGRVLCSCSNGKVLQPDGIRCSGQKAGCSGSEFDCGNGMCIPFELTCDGVNACQNGRDESESYCSNRHCASGFFHCDNNRCVAYDVVCDGLNNCGDFSDEVNCNCSEKQYRCQLGGPCINMSYVCDNNPDCPNGSDEINCDKPE